MRLRDAGVLGGAFLVLAATGGCGNMHLGSRQSNYVPPHDNTHFKSDPVTKKTEAQTQVALAQEYLQQGQNEVALDDIQKAIKLDPSSADAYTLLGFVNERFNRMDQAEAAYAKSVKLAPNNGNVLNNYGAWLCRTGHPAQADEQFRKAIADPFYKTPQVALDNAASCAYRAGNNDLAESYDRRILAQNSNNIDALQSLAGIEYHRGDYMKARAFAERLIAAGNVAPESLDLAAQIEEKLGDQDNAKAYRTRLATDFPQYTPHQL